MTRYAQAEKMEIIRLVETSDLPVKQTLAELDVPRSTFYDWYRRYSEAGYDGLADRQPQWQDECPPLHTGYPNNSYTHITLCTFLNCI